MKFHGSRPRAFGAKRARQRRNGLRTPFLDARLLALHYFRFIVAGEVADARAEYGCAGATLDELAEISGLRVARDVQIAYRYVKARNAAWPHLVRRRGNVGTSRDDLVQLNREGITGAVRPRSTVRALRQSVGRRPV